MSTIVGLDLGTNSVGWAVIEAEKVQLDEHRTGLKPVAIKASGSRIIPMDAATLGDFAKGNSVSQTKERTRCRGARRLLERQLLRRERLHRVLDLLGFLPEHYAKNLDRYGHFLKETEPKLAWRKNAEGQYEFLFMDAFREMLTDFRQHQPELVAGGKKIPMDWTLYYLRKKALTKPVSKEELAWILLNFNQKRGYNPLRGEDDETERKESKEYHALKVVSVNVAEGNSAKSKDIWYDVLLENGWIYHRKSNQPLDWVGKTKEFIVTTKLNPDGTPKLDKEGAVARSFSAPDENDWMLVKKKTEQDIERSGKTVGAYIYDALLQNPAQKVRGKLIGTVERKYYKDELRDILDAQKQFLPELQDRDLYNCCVSALYPNNEAHRNNLTPHDFTFLFLEDILFYQRPLKSKKSLIDDCPYEFHEYVDKESGEKIRVPVKCIAKSHPLFQEFRLWQFIQNLRIYERTQVVEGRVKTDVDITQDILQTEEDYTRLFDWLNEREQIDQKALFGTYFKCKKTKGKDAEYPYRWNYVEDKSYPCNETHSLMLSRLKKAGIPADALTKEMEMALWHILYSIDDKAEIGKALVSFANKRHLGPEFAEAFKKTPPFAKDYGAYSAKAIKKLLPLMRMGKYWSDTEIDSSTRQRIDKILSGEYDDAIRNRVREKAIHLKDVADFKGLPVWLACYIVYDRHSETKDINKWNSPEDIDEYLTHFKQYSLRNPIVEQVVLETLRTVRDIWKQYGTISEIHIEMGRDLKNPADKRKRDAARMLKNENANLRIKALLTEFLNPEFKIENVRPYSPSQQDLLRIYEEYALNSRERYDATLGKFVEDDGIPEDVDAILKKFNQTDEMKQPTRNEVFRYKLWLEQRYRSPYTGEMIPLARLFTTDYQIEHVIPQSRYFDDSFNNKVICESEVNKLKDNALGYEFIKNHHGEKVELNFGKVVEILSPEQYEKIVRDNYPADSPKRKKLLMDDIPEDFIARQMNDSRYISKLVKGLLSNIVREKDASGEYEQEAISKHVITCTGPITDRLKRDWGLNDKWNEIILPRFQRLNELTGRTCFTVLNNEGHEIPAMPPELQRGFKMKRIDHRHHAMDAIVIACATRDHVNLLNNEAANPKSNLNRYQLQRKLRRFETVEVERNGERKTIEVAREFLLPWPSFSSDAKKALESVIVSFKQNLRVINKMTNYYRHYKNGKKENAKQRNGDGWAIRKPLHKDTVFGEVNLKLTKTVSLKEALLRPGRIVHNEFKKKVTELLRLGYDAKRIKAFLEEGDNKDIWNEINPSAIEVYYFTKETQDRYFASRKSLDTSFDKKKITNSVTDTGIQKILLAHLEAKGWDPELAFSPDGIDEMNRNIVSLNTGKFHQPIFKIRTFEKASKFSVGQTGNKKTKFVEAADDTNLFFAIYNKVVIDKRSGEESFKRAFATIPLRDAIDRLKQGLSPVPETNENGDQLLFWLSPGDLVYLPENSGEKDVFATTDRTRIYRFIDSSGTTANFVPHSSANVIFSMKKTDAAKFCNSNNPIQNEYGKGSPQSKNQKSIDGLMIKETCLPLKVDRLGNILSLNNMKL